MADTSELRPLEIALGERTPQLQLIDPVDLDKHGLSCAVRYESTGNLGDISEAIGAQRRAVQLTHDNIEDLALRNNHLGVSLLSRYLYEGDVVDIGESVEAHWTAVHLTPAGDPSLPHRLSDLGASLEHRFQLNGNPEDISSAISSQRSAVDLTPREDELLLPRLTTLGRWLRIHSPGYAELPEISECISSQRKAVDSMNDADPLLPKHMVNLGSSLFELFDRAGDLSDLSDAVLFQQRAVNATSDDHASLPMSLTVLGKSLCTRFERAGNPTDIAEALAAQRKAVGLTPESHAELPARLRALGRSLYLHSSNPRYISDLDEVIAAQKQWLRITPERRRSYVSCLQGLASLLACRFHRSDDIQDINEAIQVQRRVLDLTPDSHPDFATRLGDLGGSLVSHFYRSGSIEHLTEAVASHRKAVKLTPEGQSMYPRRLMQLADSLTYRFHSSGGLQDIDEAIAVQQKAVSLTPEHHGELPTWLSHLGQSLHIRFRHSEDIQDISEAVLVQRRAVHLTPESHPHLPSWLIYLGSSLLSRFHCSWTLHDVTEAISVQRKAVDLTPEGHPDLPLWLTHLGNSLYFRFYHSGDRHDLTEAVSVHRRSVELAAGDSLDLPELLTRLGVSLSKRYEHSGDIGDLTEAISFLRKSVDLTSAGQYHYCLPWQLGSLGDSLQLRFEKKGNILDIDEAISVTQDAVQRTRAGSSKLPFFLYQLATRFHLRWLTSGVRADLEASIQHHRSAATCVAGSSRTRLLPAMQWATLLSEHQPSSPEIPDALDIAVRMFALLAGLEKAFQHRFYQLPKYSHLPLQAAGIACAIDQAGRAVEWLEEGRCLVWTQLNNLRTPLETLELHDGELAKQIHDLALQLESTASNQSVSNADMVEKIMLEDAARAQLDLAVRWDQLLTTVRERPGFEQFLQPMACAALLENIPESGYVVVINVDEKRCDAIALCSGLPTPVHVPLVNFSLEKANKYRSNLGAQLSSQGLRMREEAPVEDEKDSRTVVFHRRRGELGDVPIRNILRGLWNEVVKPILDAIGLSRGSTCSTTLPRIWWCPTGPLSFLPLHAAGDYGGTKTETVLDYVVSSYTPTVTALIERVKNSPPVDGKISGLFLTSQPDAIPTSIISGTTKEVHTIGSLAIQRGVRAVTIEGDEVGIDEFMKYMEKFSSIHLACHASQNPKEPLQSRFQFHKGSLELGNIIQRHIKGADLAFLSACQTSTGDEKLSDEAVHLAAGMLAAGYRRVVATMWAIGDRHAPDVARDFYEYLWSNRDAGTGDGFDASLAGRALHHTIQQLRQRLGNDSERSLLAWVPYVHFGY